MEYSLLGFKVGHLFPAIKQVIDVTIHDIRQAVANLLDRKSTRLNSSHDRQSRMPSSA